MNLLRWLFPKKLVADMAVTDNSCDLVCVRYTRYKDHIDLAGGGLISLVGVPRESVRKQLPFLLDPIAMSVREFKSAEVVAIMTGQIADEVHEFENAFQGTMKINRLLLRNNVVIELQLGAKRF